MEDSHKCVRRTQDGLSMRVWQGSDIVNDNLLMRIDILYGMAALRPEWACRLVGAAAA
jgi:P22 coat protein - gene protein 5